MECGLILLFAKTKRVLGLIGVGLKSDWQMEMYFTQANVLPCQEKKFTPIAFFKEYTTCTEIKSEFLDSSYAVSSVQKRAEFMFDEFALKLTFYISIKLNFAFSNRQKQAFYACCTLAMNSEGINRFDKLFKTIKQ